MLLEASTTTTPRIDPRTLENLLDAYRDGRTRTVQAREELATRFSRSLLTKLAETVPLDGLMLVRQADALRARGLGSARRGDLAAARADLAEAARLGESAVLGEVGRCASASLQLATEAFVDFVDGDLGSAERLLRRSIEGTCRLEDEHGFAFLEGRQIHLACNLCRVWTTRGDRMAAVRAGLDLLRYLEGSRESWPLPRPRPLPLYDTLDPGLARALCGQAVNELARALSPPGEMPVRVLRAALPPPPRPRFPAAWEWLRIEVHRRTGDLEAFCRGAVIVLRTGPAGIPQAWHATVAAAYDLCADQAATAARRLEREVARDLASMPGLSKHLRPHAARARPANGTSRPLQEPR